MGSASLPNFFVVGAPKAGTTALYHYLDQHPGIYMSPIKEPAFFAADLIEYKRTLGTKEVDPAELRAFLDGPMIGKRAGVIDEWEQYQKLFKHVRHETAIGEASGNYLASAAAPAAIGKRLPHARILMILRDPVDRLFSQYSQALSHGEVGPDFLSWVEEQWTAEQARTPRVGAVWNGFYAQHVRRYLDHFPADQVRVYLYQEYRQSPQSVLRDVFTFLNVDPDIAVDVSRRHNVTRQPRSILLSRAAAPLQRALGGLLPAAVAARVRQVTHRRPRSLRASERAVVLEIYRDDIRELRSLVKSELSDWLSASVRPGSS